jgi:hypothetical protein
MCRSSDKEKQMIPQLGYMSLRSKDNLTLVQIFTDLKTGSIRLARVMTRRTHESLWEPLNELHKES